MRSPSRPKIGRCAVCEVAPHTLRKDVGRCFWRRRGLNWSRFAAPFCSRLVLASAALRCRGPLDMSLFFFDCFSVVVLQPQFLTSTSLERQSIDVSACCIGEWRLVVCRLLDLDNFMRRCCRNTRYIEVGRHNSIGYFVSTHHTFTWWTKRCSAGERRLSQNGCATLPELAIAGFSFHRSTSAVNVSSPAAVRQHLAERR